MSPPHENRRSNVDQFTVDGSGDVTEPIPMSVTLMMAEFDRNVDTLGASLPASRWQEFVFPFELLRASLMAGGCQSHKAKPIADLRMSLGLLASGTDFSGDRWQRAAARKATVALVEASERVVTSTFQSSARWSVYLDRQANPVRRRFGLLGSLRLEFEAVLRAGIMDEKLYDFLNAEDGGFGARRVQRTYREALETRSRTMGLSDACFKDEAWLAANAVGPLSRILAGRHLGCTVADIEVSTNSDGVLYGIRFVAGDGTIKATVARFGNGRVTHRLTRVFGSRGRDLTETKALTDYLGERLPRAEETPAYKSWPDLHEGRGHDRMSFCILDSDHVVAMKRAGAPKSNSAILRSVASRALEAGLILDLGVSSTEEVVEAAKAGYAWGTKRGLGMMRYRGDA